MKKYIAGIFIACFVFTGCFAKGAGNGTAVQNVQEVKVNSYVSVSMNEGLELMKNDSNFILLDVRRQDEFGAGHIPGAVLLTNETITEENALKVIGSKERKIYVYCRSGRRSKEAAAKLIAFGFTNIIEIGGIIDYTGEIEY